jgi:hypothetical protein
MENMHHNSYPRISPASTGYSITIEGTHLDLVKFYFNGRLIASDNIRNGDGITARPHVGTTLDERALVAVRHGALKDLVSVYAFVDGQIHRSKEWADLGPGNVSPSLGVSILALPNYEIPDSYFIRGFPFSEGDSGSPTISSSYGRISFDFATLQWSYDAGNGAGWSPDPNRGEKILVIEP